MMTPTEKRYKTGLLLVLLCFGLLELPFSRDWWIQQGGFWGTHYHFWHQIMHDPLYQVTAIDFGTTGMLVLCWMVWDSWRRQHPIRVVWWVPVFLFCPTLGLLGYLLTRRGWEFPFPEDVPPV